MTNVDSAVVMPYPDRWQDMSVSGLQEEVKYLLLNQQLELKRNGHPVLYRYLYMRSQKKQQNPT